MNTIEVIATNADKINTMRLNGETPKAVRSKGGQVGAISRIRTELSRLPLDLEGAAKRSVGDLLSSVDASIEVIDGLPWNSKRKLADELIALHGDFVQVQREVQRELQAQDETQDEPTTEGDDMQDETQDETQESVELDAEAPTRLHEIEATIQSLNETAATALLSIGQLLSEARAEFDNSKDYIEWAFYRFGYKKAYTYRLKKVGESFAQDDVLAGQSVAVLHKLAAMPEEVKAEARDAVQDGETLTAASVQRTAEAEESKVAAAAPESAKENAGDSGAPWDESTGSAEPTGQPLEAVPDSADPETAEPEAASDESKTVVELRAMIRDLQDQLAEAQGGNSQPKASTAPHLPQFDSACMYARLGLSAEQASDDKAIRKAFRALVKAGYGSHHEDHAKLVEAREALQGASQDAA